MAYDKIVDSAALDAGLKQIADAIREKGGTSGSLAFPAAMTEAIAAIQAGGGGGAITSGSFTVSADTYGYSVEHGLGVIPKVIVCWVSNYENVKGYFSAGIGVLHDSIDENIVVYAASASMSGQYCYPAVTDSPSITERCNGTLTDNGAFYDANANTFRVTDKNVNSSTAKLHSGKTYVWVAVG